MLGTDVAKITRVHVLFTQLMLQLAEKAKMARSCWGLILLLL